VGQIRVKIEAAAVEIDRRLEVVAIAEAVGLLDEYGQGQTGEGVCYTTD
jgi:hypothetical protein